MKIFGYIFIAVIITTVLSVLGLALGVLKLPFHIAENTVQTGHDIIDKTITADNALYNYEWFKKQVEDIKAVKNKVILAETQVETFKVEAGAREKWTFEDKTEFARLNSVWHGLQNQLEDMVATYNARSKMANRNIFQDGLIPSSIEIGANFLK